MLGGILKRFGVEVHDDPSVNGVQFSGKKPAEVKRVPGQQFMLDATKQDRLTAGWGSFPIHVDSLVETRWVTAVARSREQYMNSDYYRAFVKIVRRNVVGPKGVVLQSKPLDADGSVDSIAAQAIEKTWTDWGKKNNCDFYGKDSWLDLQKAAIRNASRDGEYFAQIVEGKSASDWGFSLQFIDPMRVPATMKMNLPNGNVIMQGIEFNSLGRIQAYYVYNKPYNDIWRNSFYFSNSLNDYVRVPAKNIIHGFIGEFDEQKRGFPWGMPSMWRLNQMKGYDQAALVAARVGASKQGFFIDEFGEDASDKVKEYDENGEEVEVSSVEIPADASPGQYDVIPSNYRFEKFDPQYPHGEFEPFQKMNLRAIASGLGVTYHSISNDLTDVNFSSIRAGTVDERDEWKVIQEWLIESLHERVYERWLQYSLLHGKITINGKPLKIERLQKYMNVSWMPRRWDWVDPLKDIAAKEKAIKNGLMTYSDVIREMGKDPDDVFRGIANDIQRMRELGIPDEFIEQILHGRTMRSMANAQSSTRQT